MKDFCIKYVSLLPEVPKKLFERHLVHIVRLGSRLPLEKSNKTDYALSDIELTKFNLNTVDTLVYLFVRDNQNQFITEIKE